LVVRVWFARGRVVGLRRVIVVFIALFGTRTRAAGVAAGEAAAAAFEATAAAADEAEDEGENDEAADDDGYYYGPPLNISSVDVRV